MPRRSAADTKGEIAIEIGPRPIELLVPLGVPLRADDVAQVEPGANHFVVAHVALGQHLAHLLEGDQRTGVNAVRQRIGKQVGGVDPRRPRVLGHHQLLAVPVNPHLAAAAADAQGFDGQLFAFAGRLGDVAGSRQLVAVKVFDDAAAGLHLVDVLDEHRLVDDRPVQTLVLEHLGDGLQGIAGLLFQSLAPPRNGAHEHVPHVAQLELGNGESNPSIRVVSGRKTTTSDPTRSGTREGAHGSGTGFGVRPLCGGQAGKIGGSNARCR